MAGFGARHFSMHAEKFFDWFPSWTFVSFVVIDFKKHQP
jgi:hypothetical protein